MRAVRVFHAFSGLDSWGKPFREAGAQVITIDWDPAFQADLVMDIRLFAKDPQRYLDRIALARGWIKQGEHWLVDVACLGPDCRGFSVAALGHNWRKLRDGTYVSKTRTASTGVEIVDASLHILDQLRPRYWILENPRAILRKTGMMDGFHHVEISYCQYGMPYQKPTDLWGLFPPSWLPRPMCRPLAPCHESAPRGSRRGVQRVGSSEPDFPSVPSSQRAHPAGWNAGRKNRKSYGTQQDPRKLFRDGKGRGVVWSPLVVRQGGRVAHAAPLANSARAAALRSIVPRELVVEWRDAVLRDMGAGRPRGRNPRQ